MQSPSRQEYLIKNIEINTLDAPGDVLSPGTSCGGETYACVFRLFFLLVKYGT